MLPSRVICGTLAHVRSAHHRKLPCTRRCFFEGLFARPDLLLCRHFSRRGQCHRQSQLVAPVRVKRMLSRFCLMLLEIGGLLEALSIPRFILWSCTQWCLLRTSHSRCIRFPRQVSMAASICPFQDDKS